jgi:hypothetical protein
MLRIRRFLDVWRRNSPGALASELRLPSAALLVLSTALLISHSAVAQTDGNANDPAPDEISYFGESVSSLNQWPSSSGWGISYRKLWAPYLATSLAYLNDGHFPGHHRDGVTGEMWLPVNFFSQHLTVSAGLGPFYYYDTTQADNGAGYADTHGWAWMFSLDAIYQLFGDRTGPFLEIRLDHTPSAKSIETTSIGLGIGIRTFSDIHSSDPTASEGFATNEAVAYYGKTVVNSFSSQTSRAVAAEYRRKIWQEMRVAIGFVNEGNAQLIRRSGVTAELWAEPSFNSGIWSIGAGLGGYSAIDKYRVTPGRHVSGVVSGTLSLRPPWPPLDGFDIRVLWHRIVTNYNRDTDIVLAGLGYRF